MKNSLGILSLFFITACSPFADIPDVSKIYDEHRTLIAETTNVGKQTVYKDQELTHYVVNGQEVYCSELITMDLEKYRCFYLEDGFLIAGMHPTRLEPEPLQTRAPVRTAAK